MVNDYLVSREISHDFLIQEMKRIEAIYTKDLTMIKWTLENFCCDSTIGKIKTLWYFGKNYFIYQKDNPDEYLINPIGLLKTRIGDCDDFSLFTKVVLNILQIPSNYILIGDTKGFFHIAVLSNNIIIDIASDNFNQDYSNYVKKVLK